MICTDATAVYQNPRCITCGKEKVTYDCKGCQQSFCFNHLAEHQNELSQQLDGFEYRRDEFYEQLSQRIKNCTKKPIMKYLANIEVSLKTLSEQMKELRHENNFNEINIDYLKNELENLEKQLSQPENSILFPKIDIPLGLQWMTAGTTIVGGNGSGNGLNQISHPCGIDVDCDGTIYVADTDNNRIVESKDGTITIYEDQMKRPRDVIIDQENDSLIISDEGNRRVIRWSRQNRNNYEIIISNIDCWGLAMDQYGYLYVVDFEKHEVRRWKIGEQQGILVAGGNGRGHLRNQLNEPRYIFVDDNRTVYVSERENHRVMKWSKDAKEGIIVAGGHGKGSNLNQLFHPAGILVDQHETVYIGDTWNNRVVRWFKDAKQGEVIFGGNSQGEQANQLNYPIDFSLGKGYQFHIVDHNNHRVQRFAFRGLVA